MNQCPRPNNDPNNDSYWIFDFFFFFFQNRFLIDPWGSPEVPRVPGVAIAIIIIHSHRSWGRARAGGGARPWGPGAPGPLGNPGETRGTPGNPGEPRPPGGPPRGNSTVRRPVGGYAGPLGGTPARPGHFPGKAGEAIQKQWGFYGFRLAVLVWGLKVPGLVWAKNRAGVPPTQTMTTKNLAKIYRKTCQKLTKYLSNIFLYPANIDTKNKQSICKQINKTKKIPCLGVHEWVRAWVRSLCPLTYSFSSRPRLLPSLILTPTEYGF